MTEPKWEVAEDGSFKRAATKEAPRCDIEIVDTEGAEGLSGAVVLAKKLTINGQEVLVPQGTTFEIKVGDMEPLAVTMTIWPSSLTVRHA